MKLSFQLYNIYNYIFQLTLKLTSSSHLISLQSRLFAGWDLARHPELFRPSRLSSGCAALHPRLLRTHRSELTSLAQYRELNAVCLRSLTPHPFAIPLQDRAVSHLANAVLGGAKSNGDSPFMVINPEGEHFHRQQGWSLPPSFLRTQFIILSQRL